MHSFKINQYPTSRWALSFADGTMQELIKAPVRKKSPLEIVWAYQSGTETDRTYNQYESKTMSLPVFIVADSEEQLLLSYDRFVNEVLMSPTDIVLDSVFVNRRWILRYQSTSNTVWSERCVSFTIELVDDYPSQFTTVPK